MSAVKATATILDGRDRSRRLSGLSAYLFAHWPEYFMEAAGLGAFMVSACICAILLSHPNSPVLRLLPDMTLRRIMMGIAMGTTAGAIIYSPWGKRSGAHLNPAVTLTFFRLGKIALWDGFLYGVFQVCGGLFGVLLASLLVGRFLADPAVNYVVTVPGPHGVVIAFLTEFAISFVQMTAVLWVSNSRRFGRYTGLCASALVAINIATVGPLSGMSMNPARTLSSAVPAHVWNGLWIYFTAPPAAMLCAAELYIFAQGHAAVNCAKLDHDPNYRCIFCEYHAKHVKQK